MVDYKIFDRDKFTVVGTPTITDEGIASDFSSSNYLKTIQLDTSKPFKIVTPFTFKTPSGDYTSILSIGSSYVDIAQKSNRIRMWIVLQESGLKSDSLYFDPLLEDVDYRLEFEWTGSIYTAKIFDSSNTLIVTASYESSEQIRNDYLDLGYKYNPWSGSINLRDFSISVDGKEVFSGSRNANVREKLQYLRDSKEIIRQSIEAKGVEVPIETPFRQYANKIEELPEIVQMTQAEYNELAEKDPNTLYVIVG